jgi:phosphatidylglycerophosphatase A
MKTNPETAAPAGTGTDRFVATPLATWFGCGYARFAPGTWGSAGAIVPALLLAWAGWKPWHFGLLALAWMPAAIWAADRVARRVQKKDPNLVVIDEVIGQWISLAGAATLNWKTWVAAFFLFRLLDIWKPAPARQLESLHGGLGIVADDVMSGVYAALILALATRLL